MAGFHRSPLSFCLFSQDPVASLSRPGIFSPLISQGSSHSIELLKLIFQTIRRQLLGLVTLVSYYNYHQNIAYPDEPLFWVRIGGLPFTGDIHQVHEDFVSRKILGFLY